MQVATKGSDTHGKYVQQATDSPTGHARLGRSRVRRQLVERVWIRWRRWSGDVHQLRRLVSEGPGEGLDQAVHEGEPGHRGDPGLADRLREARSDDAVGQRHLGPLDTGADYGLGPTTKQLAKLDCKQLGCSDLQPEKLTTTGFRVPVITYSNVIGYRTDKFDGAKPTKYEDFFDLDKFPGKRSVASQANNGSTLEVALLADGVKPDELYPLDVDRALKKLDTIKSQLTYWETGEQSAQMLANGQAVMGTSWNGRVYTYAQEDAPVDIMWEQHFLTADYLVIPKDAPNVEAAMKLAAYMVDEKNSARISDFIAYGPPNVNAVDKVNKKTEPFLPTSHADTALALDDEWWAKNLNKVEEKFQSWRSA
ncbi:MAG: extracellular solute-binding protein [Streptosporangiales bacterium]|nr:extracellular solute-binding protein [Streptosporangiales bacterium]